MKKLKLRWERKMAGLLAKDGEDGGGGGGNGSSAWYDTLPEDMRGWDEVKNSDSPEKFYDQVKAMRSHLGTSIRIPGEDAGAEQWEEFNQKLMTKVPTLMQRPDMDSPEGAATAYAMMGRPEKAEDYAVPSIKDADMSNAEAFKPIAHKAGLNKKQFETLVTDFTQAQMAQDQQVLANLKKDQASLQTEWGADYDRRMELSTNFMKVTDAPENLVNLYEQKQVPKELSQWVFNMASRLMGENGMNLSQDENDRSKGRLTPSEAQEKINEIRGNREHPYHKKSVPGHKEAVEYMRQLYKLKAAANG